MKITKKFLTDKNACQDGIDWVIEQKLIGLTPVPFLQGLIKGEKLGWANWLIVRVMKRKKYLAYAIFAAEQVLDIYEKKYPNDNRPRKAIEAVRAVLKDDTKENRAAADAAAADAADAYAAAAAYAAADAAAAAAYAAAYAAADAADAYAAAAAADAAADADADADAYAAAAAARKEMRLKILNYGIGLLNQEK